MSDVMKGFKFLAGATLFVVLLAFCSVMVTRHAEPASQKKVCITK